MSLLNTFDTPAKTYGEYLDRIVEIDEAIMDLEAEDTIVDELLAELDRVNHLGYITV